ncbi:hypothetical protein ElyMa_005731000 [Elysia marginata]|uniref:Uncharacterized protein n=1 Tax=Elysia marginata TaxID=1093978 RepID=A0AAV4FJ78_9GAST|nr:hypothetical protein ElyMa_005731000 [Elysia marginata]
MFLDYLGFFSCSEVRGYRRQSQVSAEFMTGRCYPCVFDGVHLAHLCSVRATDRRPLKPDPWRADTMLQTGVIQEDLRREETSCGDCDPWARYHRSQLTSQIVSLFIRPAKRRATAVAGRIACPPPSRANSFCVGVLVSVDPQNLRKPQVPKETCLGLPQLLRC